MLFHLNNKNNAAAAIFPLSSKGHFLFREIAAKERINFAAFNFTKAFFETALISFYSDAFWLQRPSKNPLLAVVTNTIVLVTTANKGLVIVAQSARLLQQQKHEKRLLLRVF